MTILKVEHVFTWQQNVNAGNMSDTFVGVINLLYLILNRLNFHIVIYSMIFWDAHAVVPISTQRSLASLSRAVSSCIQRPNDALNHLN